MSETEAIVGSIDGQPLRAAFPLCVTLFGVEAVVIPADEYRRLVGAGLRLPLVEAVARARRGPSPIPSTIERDPEVAAFLRERFALADTIEMARAACEARFGPDRTPSASRIARLRDKARRGA